MTTNYAGIDYSSGQPINKDLETGIRYGLISPNSVMSEAVSDIYANGTDRDYEAYQDEIRAALKAALKDFGLEDQAGDAFDALETGDAYQSGSDCARMAYSDNGLDLITDSQGEIWVLKSPYFTYAQFCSPCAPGACNLNSPLESPISANKCYCLGLDWFDDETPCQYPIYDIATGELVKGTIAGI